MCVPILADAVPVMMPVLLWCRHRRDPYFVAVVGDRKSELRGWGYVGMILSVDPHRLAADPIGRASSEVDSQESTSPPKEQGNP